MRMKKFTTIMGALGALLFTSGMLAKFLRWPISGPAIVFGALLLILFFLPSYGYNLFYQLSGKKSKTLGVFGGITFCLIGLATVSKFMHWPGAGPLLILEFGLTALLSLPFLLIIRIKAAENGRQKLAILSGHLALALLVLGILFRMMRWPGGAQLMIFGSALLLLVYLPVSLLIYNNDEGRNFLKNKIILLPFIALLTFYIFGVGASTGILNSFIPLDNSIKESEKSPDIKKEMYYASCKKNKHDEPYNTNIALLYTKEMKVKELSDDLYNHIEKLKAYLISQTDRTPLQDTTPELRSINSKDNYDIPTFILIGGDELNPKKGAYSALELRAKIDVYRTDILSMYSAGIMKESANKTIGLKTDGIVFEEGVSLPWETSNFYHLPIVTVITILSKLQLDVRTTEIATIEYLYNTSMQVGVAEADRK